MANRDGVGMLVREVAGAIPKTGKTGFFLGAVSESWLAVRPISFANTYNL